MKERAILEITARVYLGNPKSKGLIKARLCLNVTKYMVHRYERRGLRIAVTEPEGRKQATHRQIAVEVPNPPVGRATLLSIKMWWNGGKASVAF